MLLKFGIHFIICYICVMNSGQKTGNFVSKYY